MDPLGLDTPLDAHFDPLEITDTFERNEENRPLESRTMASHDHKRIRQLMQSLLGHGAVVKNVARADVCVLSIMRKCRGWVPLVVMARLLVVPKDWLLDFLGDKDYMVNGEGGWEFALSVGEAWVSAASGQGWLSRSLAEHEAYFTALDALLATYPPDHWFHSAPAMHPTVPQVQWKDDCAPEPRTPAPERFPTHGQWS